MLLSRCCKKDIYVILDYYVCYACDLACDVTFINDIGKYNDAREQTKTQESASAT